MDGPPTTARSLLPGKLRNPVVVDDIPERPSSVWKYEEAMSNSIDNILTGCAYSLDILKIAHLFNRCTHDRHGTLIKVYISQRYNSLITDILSLSYGAFIIQPLIDAFALIYVTSQPGACDSQSVNVDTTNTILFHEQHPGWSDFNKHRLWIPSTNISTTVQNIS